MATSQAHLELNIKHNGTFFYHIRNTIMQLWADFQVLIVIIASYALPKLSLPSTPEAWLSEDIDMLMLLQH